jgi:hypothetical protein
MAINMKTSIEVFDKIKDKLKRKHTILEIKGLGISFEEMMGDQLFGHPAIKKITPSKKI